MKKLYIMVMAIIVISGCVKKEEGGSTCTCKNSDDETIGTYSGLSSSQCSAKANTAAGEYCALY